MSWNVIVSFYYFLVIPHVNLVEQKSEEKSFKKKKKDKFTKGRIYTHIEPNNTEDTIKTHLEGSVWLWVWLWLLCWNCLDGEH